MAYNHVYKNDSSGSDDDYGLYCPGAREMHYHASCRYNKFKTVLGGRVVYVWLRSCFCSHYISYDIRQGVTNISEKEEGKDVHFTAECRWRRAKKGDGWELSKKCLNCGSPSSASYTTNASGPCSPS